jgi:CDP-glycerol glycerophosphotransferase (TagB/SpsB family)
MKRHTIFLGIAFGTSVRDVLRNDTFKILKERNDIDIVVFSQETGKQFQEEFSGSNVFIERLIDFTPSFWEKFVLNFHKAILRDKSRTIDLGNTSGDKKLLNIFTPFAKFLKLFLSHKQLTSFVFWLYNLDKSANLYKDEFIKYKPDLVVVTRVLNFSKDYPLLKSAVANNVPVVSLVSSWDNLTSKGFFPFKISSLVVWNDVIKQEAIDLFNFPENQIHITGIPRYDFFYKNKDWDSKQVFCAKFGLDPDKKTILYGTGSAATGTTKLDDTSPEPEICEFIVNSINKGLINFNAQLLIRLHPQANPQAYKFLSDLPNVFIHIPGQDSTFHDRLFSVKDDKEFGESLKYSDVVINMASTITIDATVFDIPVIGINFDFRGERPFEYSIRRLYHFDHFAKLKVTEGFKLANSKTELIEMISTSLTNRDELKANRVKMINQQCFYTDGKSGERVSQVILEHLSK